MCFRTIFLFLLDLAFFCVRLASLSFLLVLFQMTLRDEPNDYQLLLGAFVAQYHAVRPAPSPSCLARLRRLRC